MAISPINIKKWKSYADWKLLALLLLFLNVKLAIKIPAIALIYLLQFDFKFGFSLKNSRLPLFYLLIIPLSFVGLFIGKGYQNINYLIVFATGLFFWLLCILAIHQIKLSVEKQSAEVLHNTLLLFFAINAGVSAINLLRIIIETHALNPYTYQGNYQKYFIGTGDYIKGVTFDTSTTNAAINAMGVIYFLVRQKPLMLIACMATLLLTGSNFINIVLLLVLALLFIFRSTRMQKSLVVICLMLLVTFMVKVSPQNNTYVAETIKNTLEKPARRTVSQTVAIPLTLRPDSELNPEERKEKFAKLYLDSLSSAEYLKDTKGKLPVVKKEVIRNDDGRILLPQANIHSAKYQSIKVPQAAQQPLIRFINTHDTALPISAKTIRVPTLPGKAISVLQTAKFLVQHPAKILTGDGMGNFSSKLAFRATGLGIAGGYPHQYAYINHDFLENHLDVYLDFFSKQTGLHSLTNSPFSVYDQLLAEYGLIGLVLFFIYYLWFFARHYRKLTYGLPILLLLMAVLFVDYWFEQLSIMVFFELLLFLNIKETAEQKGELTHA
ncbi:hypothetical protein IDJ77_13835 [Mucilaginibacter sp. ZT4R22]|uniref:O-antigen ligase-like membrane protein n=1 Tax=Mucilaginibacter pankratovii TaxID=2772110 RepID=A0ABR7WRG2_9SPHI|nr:hypothetical protein [Mucilaginibacter pankratovii]MBD1364898.1 hypothetical protein [Mucilaginibacter pankratovii]